MLNKTQIDQYLRTGHLTVEGVFAPERMQAAVDDASCWGKQFLADLGEKDRDWYVEKTRAGSKLRKLDNPVYHRQIFRKLACDPELVSMVEQLVGQGVRVFFSQIFFKPPQGGGPKPIHQDNYYFGPDKTDAMITAWVALEDATAENGCLYYGDGSNHEPLLLHSAPEGEPFNLQIAEDLASRFAMTPAPVPRGGVSFHHGHTLHRSSSNVSANSRCAAAFHFLQNDARLVSPKLEFDPSVEVTVS